MVLIKYIVVLLLTPSALFNLQLFNNKLNLKKKIDLQKNINHKLLIPENPNNELNYICVIYTGGNDNVQIVDLPDFLGNTQLELINMNFYDNENNIITSLIIFILTKIT